MRIQSTYIWKVRICTLINKNDLVAIKYDYGGLGIATARTHLVFKSSGGYKELLRIQGWKAKYGIHNNMYRVDKTDPDNLPYPFKIESAIDFSSLTCINGLLFSSSLKKGNIGNYKKIQNEVAKRCVNISKKNLDINILIASNCLLSKI